VGFSGLFLEIFYGVFEIRMQRNYRKRDKKFKKRPRTQQGGGGLSPYFFVKSF
jgi:hypothetical protein